MRHPVAEKVYRLILRFYPREFRERFGTDMASAYRAARLDAANVAAPAGWNSGSVSSTDGLVRAPVEHLHMTMSDLRYAARGLDADPGVHDCGHPHDCAGHRRKRGHLQRRPRRRAASAAG